MSCRLFKHHFRSANNRFVCLDIDTTFAAYFTRLVHKDISHSQTSQAQVQDHIQQQLSQPNVLNMARYRKAVHSALWVQLALVVCYTPCYIVGIIVTYSTTYSSHLVVILQMATILVSFNSTLNPFLYCRWRLLKWDKQWSRQSDKHFAVHGVRPFSSYSWSYKYLQCKADR